MAEPKDPKRPLLGTPGAPLPRLWKAEPDEEPEDEKPAKKSKKDEKPAEPVRSAKVPNKKGADKKSREPKKAKDVKDGEPKGVLKEETPTFDTYDTRQRVRIAAGAGLTFVILLIGFFVFRLISPPALPEDEPINQDVIPIPSTAGTQPQRDEEEARSLFERAREVASNKNTNLAVTPCPFQNPYSITLGNTRSLTCTSPTGPFAFLAGATEDNTSRNVYAVFTELALPITDTIDGQFALRYEDYGAGVGSTVDPKLGIRWQALDWLTLRGSATTTFRGPPQSYLAGQVTSLVFIVPTSAFKAVNVRGNPELQSESATTWSYGFIVKAGGFTGTVDYWKYDLKDPFQLEDPNQIVNAYTAQNCFIGATGTPTANCANLASHITPLAVPPSQIERIDVNFINGTNIDTSGVDVNMDYVFDDVFNGELSFGLQGTYTLDYNSDDFKDISGVTLAPGGDFVGKMNIGTPFTSLPDTKGNVYAKYVHGSNRFTYMIRYIGDYTDETASVPQLRDVDSVMYQDFYYNVTLFNDSLLLNVGVTNFLDEDPPKTSTNLNYDPYTADPFGRMYKIGFTYTLGAAR